MCVPSIRALDQVSPLLAHHYTQLWGHFTSPPGPFSYARRASLNMDSARICPAAADFCRQSVYQYSGSNHDLVASTPIRLWLRSESFHSSSIVLVRLKMLPILRKLAWLCLFFCVSLTRSDVTSDQIAAWDRPRSALIRYDIYLEGGILKTGTFNGEKWSPSPTRYEDATLFTLNLNKSFDIHNNKPAIFKPTDTTISPVPWLDGFMVADYDEFYTYG